MCWLLLACPSIGAFDVRYWIRGFEVVVFELMISQSNISLDMIRLSEVDKAKFTLLRSSC